MAEYIYERWDYLYDLSVFPFREVGVSTDISVVLLNKDGNLSEIYTTTKSMSVGEVCISTSEVHEWETGSVGWPVGVRVIKSSNRHEVYQTTRSELIATLHPTVLIEETIAEEGTYPDNGIQGDYWYIKTRKAFPDLHIKVNGELRKVQSAWVKVGGHTTPELPEGHREYIAYANSPDGVQDFSLTPDGHAYVGLYQGLDPDDLRGEGENLLPQSSLAYGRGPFSGHVYTTLDTTQDFLKVTSDEDRPGSPGIVMYDFTGKLALSVGDVYTLSFDIRSSNTKDHAITHTGGTAKRFKASPVWSRISYTFTAPEGNNNHLYIIHIEPIAGDSFDIKNVKLEKGSTATPWTPAPADILAAINNPNSYTWMSKSMYMGVLKEVKDIYVKKDGQLKKGI